MSGVEPGGERPPLFMVATGLTALSVLAALCALGRDIIAAAAFGASPELDAFIVASLVPTTLFTLLVGAANYAYVPVAIRTLRVAGARAYDALTETFVFLGVVGAAAFVGVSLAFSDPIAHLLLAGAAPRTIDRGAELLRLLTPSIAAAVVAPVLGATLVAQRALVPVALANLTSVLIVFTLLLVRRPTTASDYALYTDTGFIAQATGLMLLGRARRIPLWPRFSSDEVFALARALAAGTIGWLAWQFNQVVDRAFAAGLSEGAVTVSAYAFRTSLVVLVVVWPLTTTLVSYLPHHGTTRQRELLFESTRTVLLVVFPASALLLAMRFPLMSLLLVRGQFTVESAKSAAELLGAYALTLPIVTMVLLLTTSLFATDRRRAAAYVSIGAIILEALSDYIAVRTFGLLGLAIGFAVVMSTALITLSLIQRDLVAPIAPQVARSVLRYVVAALALIAVAQLLGQSSPERGVGQALHLALAAVAALAVYLVVLLAFHSPELKMAARLLSRGSRTT